LKLAIDKIRSEFPALHQNVYNKPLIYFDNAATTQKPIQVIEAINNYYRTINSNIHRGVHYLSQKATTAYEESRIAAKNFINANSTNEIIFTKGTTESINLVASGIGKKFLKKGDNIIVSAMEHHSNIVPWQMICEEKEANLRVIPMNENGELLIEKLESLIDENTRIISVAHISNALGTINPIKQIIEIAHKSGIPVLIDGAQAVSHLQVDVKDLDCEFYCFSGHKMFGPTGIGVLYGKEKWLEDLPPYQGGGEMIKEVTFEKTTYNELPFKFEAGTPNVADGIAFKAAIDYITSYGLEEIALYENELLQHATEAVSRIDGLNIYGTAAHKAAVLSFNIKNIHPYDIGTLLDKMGIAVRTGHHCAQPVMDFFGIPGTVRASFAFYNTIEEIDVFVEGIKRAKSILE
jgi:cysteine desulfurase / selenocysteine lyase